MPGTYSPQYADLRLLAIPTSRRRVAACDPTEIGFLGFALPRGFSLPSVSDYCSTCVAQDIRGMMT